MGANPFLGVFLHAVGGLAAGSFYLPFKGVRKWSWEVYWLVGGFFSWIVAPWVIALIAVPHPVQALLDAPVASLVWAFFFGTLWGIGGLTFGLSMRYLGLSLGYAVALGFCAAFGTLIPPIFDGSILTMIQSASGLVILAGIGVTLVGIAICGRAGILKERELSDAQRQAVIQEYNFSKGIAVACLSGVMSACMAFAIAAAKPIGEAALALGAPELFQNSPAFIVIFAGGFLTNLLWCSYLLAKNGSTRDYFDQSAPLLLNYVLSAVAGTIWYFQFMFYGMGTTQMGAYDFSSWTLHMAFIIVFSNLWALTLREWKGSSGRTLGWITGGIAVLIFSTVIIGIGNWIAG
ncbi:MAG: L-rhamnose/proton symporter RhaT [Candidatus Hydrogenedentes bacterium]|nr:L-rhamnose/proton symporter RhaT [Candidatus Hydrogenedentota bacterium]